MVTIVQWFNLLNRPSLAPYFDTYTFTRDADDDGPRNLPLSVLNEIFIALALLPALVVDATRPVSP